PDGWKETLLKEINSDDLPAYLGGNRTDPEGNPLCESFNLWPTLSYTQEERPLLTFIGGIHQLIHGTVVKARVLLYVLRGIGKTKALARLSSGHLKTLRFSLGDKKFNICTKCNTIEATPQHLLDCVALVYDDLLKQPDFVLEVMKANGLMDLI
ncbi:hypothetical protein AVEN_260572-1, partial [Araneus ventricosus]